MCSLPKTTARSVCQIRNCSIEQLRCGVCCSRGTKTSWQRRQSGNGRDEGFYGIVYAHQIHVSIGQCIKDLDFLCSAGLPEDVLDTVWHCPMLK